MLEKLNVLTRIIEKIKRFPVTFESMQEWIKYENIEISDRTLYRYLREAEDLRMNEGRIISVSGDFNKKTWKFEYDTSDNALKENDIINLLLLKGFFPGNLATHRKQSIEKINETIFKAQSKSKFEYHLQTHHIKQISSLHFGEHAYNAKEQETIDRLIWTIHHYRKIQITEFAPHAKQRMGELPITAIPVQIIYHNGIVYLMCLTENNTKLQAIGISSISEFEILNMPFDIKQYEHDYNLQLGKRFGIEENIDDLEYEITLRFSSDIGKSLSNRRWHGSQKTSLLPNGKLEMNLICGINSELIDWILHWNKHVEILNPPILLQKVRERALDFLKLNQVRLDGLA